MGSFRVQSMVATDQHTAYNDGTEAIISKKETSIIAMRPRIETYQPDYQPSLQFVVSVYNGSGKPIVFSTENVSASVADTQIKVFSYEEIVAQIEAQRRSMALSAALLGASQMVNARSAGTQYQYGTYNTGGGGTGTYYGYSYNPAAVAQAQAMANMQTMQNINVINSSANGALSEANNTLLKKQTVPNNVWYGGQITLGKLPLTASSKELTINLKVSFENEEHLFKFTLTKIEPAPITTPSTTSAANEE